MRALLRIHLAVLLLAVVAAQADASLETCIGDLGASDPDNVIIEMVTNMGTVCIELFEKEAPYTARNFRRYIRSGLWDGTIVHRAIQGPGLGIIQLGGFHVPTSSGVIESIDSFDPIPNETCVLDEDVPGSPGVMQCSHRGNERGTLAMAKVGDSICDVENPPCVPRPTPAQFPRPQFVNSATNGFFFSTQDNRENLDNQNGGFTAFGQVLGNGMDIIDAIIDLPKRRVTSRSRAWAVAVSAQTAAQTIDHRSDRALQR